MDVFVVAELQTVLATLGGAAVGLAAGAWLARRPSAPSSAPPAGQPATPDSTPVEALLASDQPLALTLTSPDGRLLSANPAGLALLGRSVGELRALRPAELLAEQDRPAFDAAWARAAEGAPFALQATLQRPDGGTTPAVLLAHRLGDGRLLTLIRDLPGERSGSALRQAHRQLEAALESFPDPLALFEPGGRVLFLNRLWRERQSAEGWPLPELRADQTIAPEASAIFAPLLDQGRPDRTLSSPSGWSLRATSPSDPRAPLTIIRARLNPSLAEGPQDQENLFLAKVLETTAALILVLDREGRVITFNDACRRMTGFSAEEVLGRPFWETVIPPEDRERFQSGFARLVSTGEARPSENPWLGKDGRRHLVLWSNAVLRAPDGSVSRVIATGIDVTDTRRMQHELVQAQRMEAIGQLAGGIAHDFNNLLTAIFGHTALAKRLIPASHEAFSSLERVEQAAEQAGRVIRSLLTFSRTERSDKAPIAVTALLQDTAGLIRGLLPATIELRTFPVPSSLWIEADRLQIQQAILNLAINARDSMPAGGALRLSAIEAPGPAVAIVIEDSGQGIPREILPRVFEPFFTTKPKSSGGGLGLPVAKSIATDHGGSLSLASEPGVGTRATLTIPLCPAPAATPTLEAPDTLRLLVGSPRSYPRQIMVSALATLGAPVQGFSSAEHFAAEVRNAVAGATIAICDTAVVAAVPTLLATAAERRIPILVLGDPANLADLSALGAAILAEPFTTAQLMQAVRRLIEIDRRAVAEPTYSR